MKIYGKHQAQFIINEDTFIVEVENKKEFMKELHCNHCKQKISSTPYFCPTEHIFFHKPCLMRAKHPKIPRDYDAFGQHQDHPVIIEQKKEVKQNGDM